MLSVMRSGAKSMIIKTFLFGLLLLAMFGLAIMDVQGMFRKGVQTTTLVKIGREKISTTEFNQTVQNILRGQRIPEAQAYASGLPRMILDQEINRRLLQRAAADLGILIDDKTVAPQVKAILAPLVEKGMSEKEAFDTLLSNYGMSEAKFVGTIKAQIATEKLAEAISSGARAPQQLMDDTIKHSSEWRQGEYFTLNASDATGLKEPSESDLKAHYTKISSRFAVPEYRSFSVLVLDKKALGLEGAIADDVLKQHYDDNIAEYSTPEMRRVSQIVVKEEAEAAKIFEKVKKSKDLKKASDAEGKAKANYVLGTYGKTDLPEDISKKAFDALEGDIIEPFNTPLGWHIVHVEQIHAPTTQPFDSVKARIAKELSEDKSSDALYERANKIDDMLAGGASLAEVAAEYKLTPFVFTLLDNTGTGKDGKKPGASLSAFDKVVKEVFGLDKGEASQMIETPEGAFLIAEVSDILPSAEEPFEKVRSEVARLLKDEQTGRALDEKAAKAVERLKLGDAFDKVAADAGKKILKTDFIQRNTPQDKAGALPRGLIPSLFSLDKIGSSTTVGGEGGSVHILKLAGRKIDTSKDQKKEDLENLTTQLNRSLQKDILDQYRRALMAEYDVKINEELLQEMFAPKDDVVAE